MRKSPTLLTFSILILFVISCNTTEKANLVLQNGKIATVDKNFSIQEAVAVKGDKIIFVGSNKDVTPFIGNKTKVINLEGKLTLPGLIDAHGHLASYGSTLEMLDLNNTTSFKEIIEIIDEKVKTSEPEEWIQGRGWNQNKWENKAFPIHDALSAVSPDNPVYLKRTCGHASIANKKAMEIAGINSSTTAPEGGKIHKKKNGEPTGVFIDVAMGLISSKIKKPNKEQTKELIENACNSCLAVGLTGMHDAGIPPDQINIYKEMIDEGRLSIRVYGMIGDPGEGNIDEYLKTNKLDNYKNFLSVKTIKLFADGALGSRGAAMIEPYSDDPENYGLIISDFEHIYETTKIALKNNMQVAIHAIGDNANRISLNAFEKAINEVQAKDHRLRIEHSQIVAKEDIPRFNVLGVLPSMQPTSAVSDMTWALDRVGEERIKGAYAWRQFLNTGCILPLSSDFPVETNNPIVGIYSAVTCSKLNGEPTDGYFSDERLTVEEAIKGFTIWAAFAAFQEDKLGSIEKGKLADFTILDKDILTIDTKEIHTAKPVYTIVGGKVAYSNL